MPFSKPLYFDNILHKKAGFSRKNTTKFIAETCNETNKSLLDIVDETKILDENSHLFLSARQIAELPSTNLKRLARANHDYFVCRLSRPSSTIFSDAETKPFIISYRGRLCTGSRLSSLDTKHEATPYNPAYFSPYAYLETIVLPADDTTAGMLSVLTSNNTTPDLSTFGKLYATPVNERIHLSFEYSDETCSYEMPTFCSCLVAEAIVLIRKKKVLPSVQVFHIKNNVISYRYSVNIPQKETQQEPSTVTRDRASEILEQFEHFTSAVTPGIILNQDAVSLINSGVANSIDYIINTAPGDISTSSN